MLYKRSNVNDIAYTTLVWQSHQNRHLTFRHAIEIIEKIKLGTAA